VRKQTKPMRALVVAGARPNFVKISPLLRAFRRYRDVETLLVHTGQHYSKAMSAVFFRDLEIPLPDVNLEVGSGSHARQTGEVMKRFEPVVEKFRPDVVVVVGDVNSTLACALTAAKLCVPAAHVEAGLRSFDRTMPEEINRLLTDQVSDFLFATEPSAVRNLRREGIPGRKIHLVGNIMVDALRYYLPRATRSGARQRLGLAVGGNRKVQDYILLTLHRPSNVDDGQRLRQILRVVARLGEHCPVIFPVHPRTRKQAAAAKKAEAEARKKAAEEAAAAKKAEAEAKKLAAQQAAAAKKAEAEAKKQAAAEAAALKKVEAEARKAEASPTCSAETR